MNLRIRALLVFLAVLLPGAAARAAGPNPHRLKPGAQGRLCLECHATFLDKVKLPFVHTPVKSGDCVDCHSPHASDHGKLLSAGTNALCARCHPGAIAEKARSIHAPVAAGECVKCHDPHASASRNVLRLSGNQLCAGCHPERVAAAAQSRFQHSPVAKDCLGCHDPHASTRAPFLLKKEVPALCGGCHRTDQPAFVQQHMNYPVARGRCTSCHDPHGSSNSGLLWATVHSPVAGKMCRQCHPDPSAPDALSTRKTGFEICRPCHSPLLNEMFSKNRVHYPALDRTGCLNCHNPHAAAQKALLRKPAAELCRSCHADTVTLQERSLTRHPPAEEGLCSSCHDPHASDPVFLLVAGDLQELCGTCHDYNKHASHPIGDKVVDQRNPNLTVNCQSCHRTHGSQFKSFTHADPGADLCVQCHQEMRR